MPLTSTSGGLPGDRNRSLIFVEVFSMDASNAGVGGSVSAAAGAAAAPVLAVGTAAGLGVAVEAISERWYAADRWTPIAGGPLGVTLVFGKLPFA